jgi:D-proline reductase (dithiol) PrdB
LTERYRGLAKTTYDFLRAEYLPDFDWACFDQPSQRVLPTRPLPQARIALVSTAGAHLPEQPPHHGGAKGDHTYRVIPVESEQIRLHHPGYDVRLARKDPGVVFPLKLLRDMAAEGAIGEVAPRAFSFMGYIPYPGPLLTETGPEVADCLIADQVNLALLVPA